MLPANRISWNLSGEVRFSRIVWSNNFAVLAWTSLYSILSNSNLIHHHRTLFYQSRFYEHGSSTNFPTKNCSNLSGEVRFSRKVTRSKKWNVLLRETGLCSTNSRFKQNNSKQSTAYNPLQIFGSIFDRTRR